MLELNNIYCSDNVRGMKQIDDESIDLIVTSPPYDSIRKYNKFEFSMHNVGEESFRILKEGGIFAMVINDGTKDFGKSLTTYRTILDYCDNIGFKLFENIIYSRQGVPGAWWTKRFRVDHEYILLFLKGKRPKYFDKEPLKIDSLHPGKKWSGTKRMTDGTLTPINTIQKKKKCRGTIWKYNTSSTEGNKVKMMHPATFPDKLAEDLIICFSDKSDIIVDPFVGSGTTAAMAKKLGRNYIAFDVSQEYCDIANNILDNMDEEK